MEYNQFLAEVQQHGSMNSPDEAKDAVRTTFSTLALRLPAEEARELMQHLPAELARYFEKGSHTAAEPFSLDYFFQRINDEEGIDMPTASQYVRAVMDTLRDSLPEEQYQRLRTTLPEEFISMFDTGGDGTTT